ncbi:ABC transporter ATP-binding protein [Micromonospora tarensis]|uniref:ATP-binding cassette domain-containing protein n=1 Tax=Micromonospora tarensis TaxID=2806100 RepID=A0ABS1YA51_9ACTN|nr:ATP-binding cassette domain-containing protein [Micromonospora tarensis]MBM0274280.1 ATP-binding cassette domain-containing protein [Micromonospora tarensis]
MRLGWLKELWRDRVALLRLLKPVGGVAMTGLLATHLVVAVAPPGVALATGWLVREADVGWSLAGLLAPLCVIAVLILLSQVGEALREPLELLASRRVDGRFRARIRARVAATPGIRYLEDNEYVVAVGRASELGGWRERTPGTAATGQLTVLSRMFSALASAAVIAGYSPLLAVGVLAMILVMRSIIRRQWIHLNVLWDVWTDDRLRMDYWSSTLTGLDTSKEVRLFGLARWLADRRQDQALGWITELWRERRRILRAQGWTFLLAAVSGFAAFYVPAAAVQSGSMTVADLITVVVAAWGVFAIGNMGWEAFDIEHGKGALRAYARLAVSEADRGRRELPVSATPASLRFQGLSHRYPGATRPVLDRLDLNVGSGEVLAVVGRNGAGKTTLVKVLAGLYKPTAGRITADGVDLAEVDPDHWRRHITAVFQDFVRYPGTVRENIVLGAPEVPPDDEAIRAALELAGGGALLARLPAGLDSLLARDYTGGIDLSGGEWQTIAIGRALYAVRHGRRVLVLDEPTAHLDVRAEADFYGRVIGAVTDATIILISHRLSTVRRADRIVFLEAGRIVEQGTHDELVAGSGRYAQLYELQARRFRSPRDPVTS